jgi:hypothetical protein
MVLNLTKSQIEQKVVEKDGECPPCVTDVPMGILRHACDEEGKVCQAIDQFGRDEITAEQMLIEVYNELDTKENVQGVREYLEIELR